MTDTTAASTPAPIDTDADLDAQEADELAKLEKLQAERTARAAKLKESLAKTASATATPVVEPAPVTAPPAAPVPSTPPVAQGVKLAARRWYATGKTAEVGMKFDPAWAAPKPNVHSEYVLLKGILSESEDAEAVKGGESLAAVVAKYGVEQRTTSAAQPTVVTDAVPVAVK
jgi:hypothetical protein